MIVIETHDSAKGLEEQIAESGDRFADSCSLSHPERNLPGEGTSSHRIESDVTGEQIEVAMAWIEQVRPGCGRASRSWDLVEQNPTGDRRLDMRLRGLLTVAQATSEHLSAEKADLDAWITGRLDHPSTPSKMGDQ